MYGRDGCSHRHPDLATTPVGNQLYFLDNNENVVIGANCALHTVTIALLGSTQMQTAIADLSEHSVSETPKKVRNSGALLPIALALLFLGVEVGWVALLVNVTVYFFS